ncbi:MAG: hypothetical protein WA510_28810 [Acidobacteriaceae bacterium]
MTEVYRGTAIAITTTPAPGRGWTARAEYQTPDTQSVRVEAPQTTYATEPEARQAALQAAVETIDRQRIATGKK